MTAQMIDALGVDTMESLAAIRLRGVLYSRVSKDKSGRGRSVAEQEDIGRAQFDRADIELVDVLHDLVGASEHTAAHKARGDFAKLCAMISASEIDVVGAWSLDRVTRDDIEWPTLARLCKRHDVILFLDGRKFDLEDPDDAYQLDSEAARAKYEIAKLRKRVLRALKANAESGLPHGRPTFGYRHVYDRRQRLVGREIDAATSAVVREIFARVEGGESLRAIGLDFDRRGIDAPSKCDPDCDLDHSRHYDGTWGENAPSRLRKIALNASYIGTRTYRGEIIVENAWQPIVERDQFERVGVILRDTKRRWQGLDADRSIRHLLSGLLVCSVCGGSVRACVQRAGRKTPARRYRCKKLGCVSRSQDLVESTIERLIVSWLQSPSVAAAWSTEADAERLRADTIALGELTAQLDDAESAWHANEISARAFGGLESRLAPQIESLRAEIARLREPVPASILALSGDEADARWAAATIEQRRAVIAAILPIMRLLPRSECARDLTGLAITWRGSEIEHVI